MKWSTLRSYHCCVREVTTGMGGGGQLGLDSRQGQDISLLHDVQYGSGAQRASYTVSTGGSFTGMKTSENDDYFNIVPSLISRDPSFHIESRATPGVLTSLIYKILVSQC
jgi:hypothetical protein